MPTENQRFMHLLLDSSTSTGGNKNVRIAALGYINAFGIWSDLLKYDGDPLPKVETAQQNGTVDVTLMSLIYWELIGCYSSKSNNADDISDWPLRVAFSSF